jgi:hypothetical protein
MSASNPCPQKCQYLVIWSRWALALFMALVLGACGDDTDEPEFFTVSAASDYQNVDQSATFIAEFTIHHLPEMEPPLPRIYTISSYEDLALFAGEFSIDLASEADLDFDLMDYFVVVEMIPCARLYSREGFVREDQFHFETVYYKDKMMVCIDILTFRGLLYAVEAAAP